MVKEAGGTKVLYMHPLTMATALDIIGITTLGVDFDSLRRPDQPFLRAYQAVFPSFEKQTLLAKFLGAVLPALVSPRTLLKLPLPLIKKFHWGMATLRQFCIEQIRTKKEEIQGSEVENKDVRQKGVWYSCRSSNDSLPCRHPFSDVVCRNDGRARANEPFAHNPGCWVSRSYCGPIEAHISIGMNQQLSHLLGQSSS